MMEIPTQNHTINANGLNIWNILFASSFGRLVSMPAPSSIYGLVKSITVSRIDVIVKGPTAKSTSCNI